MFERARASWRPDGSEDRSGPAEGAGRDPEDGLTRAQARARARCQPLTPDEFKARRRVADQAVSLSRVLDEGANPRRP